MLKIGEKQFAIFPFIAGMGSGMLTFKFLVK